MTQKIPSSPLENIAAQKIDREIGRRTGQSIFTGGGDLREDAASFASNGRMEMGQYLNLGVIPWAPDPDGGEHCQNLARLVEYMATLPGPYGGVVGGPLDERDQKILHAVAMLYAVGKGDPRAWLFGAAVANTSTAIIKNEPAGEHGYEQRSAEFANRFLLEGNAANTIWGQPTIREDICRLIAKHNNLRDIAEDKRLQVFADARRLELARINPNTSEGMVLLKREWQPDKFYMGWARNKENARTWMLRRGWK